MLLQPLGRRRRWHHTPATASPSSATSARWSARRRHTPLRVRRAAR